jgi:hypothetical protein
VDLLSDTNGIGTLGVRGDAEVGPVTVREAGFVTLIAGSSTASLDGTNGNAVSLGGIAGDNIHLIAEGPGTDNVGALTVGEGAFLNLGGTLGLGESPVANLHVNGSVDFAASGGFGDIIDSAGTTAGVNYGELTATGNIALNGASFSILGDGGGCPPASDIGASLPLISTPGTISGTFAGAADGVDVSIATSPCSEMMQMHYSPHEIYGTIVNTTGVAATLTPSATPSPAVVGDTVTYSATVSGPSGTPTGSVTFDLGGGTLCSATLSGGSGSCTSSAAPEGNPDDITVYYSGDTTYRGSTGGLQLPVNALAPPPPPPPPSHGYWLVGSDGGIFSFGSAQFYGSMGGIALQRPVVGIVPTADRGGYWLDASDGGVFSFGDTQFYGSIPGLGLNPAGSGKPNSLNAPIVGMVPSHDQGGYFMVASDGGVFAFGDAHFAGSCPGIGGCSGAAVAVMPDASGNGYWLVTSSGNVYTFGDAPNLGAPGPQSSPITSAVATPNGGGYDILDAIGQVFSYGDAPGLGSAATGATGGLNPASAIFVTSDNAGYWVSDALGDVYTFGNAPNDGSMAGTHLNGSIIAASGS